MDQEKKTIFSVSAIKNGDEEDVEVVIGENIKGSQIEIALALLVQALGDRQRKIDPDFKDVTIIRSIEQWHRSLRGDQ